MNEVIVAPFSNSDIRDWPAGHFATLIDLILSRWPAPGIVRVIGTPSQSIRACDIVRHLDASRVANDCGRMSWVDVLDTVRRASCVIGNNSGIAHLASYYGVPTVCVFGGSHQRQEWRPLGFRTITLSRVIGCSPCHLDHGSRCPYDKACLREIEPAQVAAAVLSLLAPDEGMTPDRNDDGDVRH